MEAFDEYQKEGANVYVLVLIISKESIQVSSCINYIKLEYNIIMVRSLLCYEEGKEDH